MIKAVCGCGKEIVGIRRTKRFCDDCARAQRKQNGLKYREKIGAASSPRDIVCACCGADAVVPTRRHKYCADCASRFVEVGSSVHYHLRRKGDAEKLGETVGCAECGEPMTRRAAAHRFCSKACLSAHQRRQASLPENRLNNRMRAGIWATIKGKKNGRQWQSLVGYSVDDLKRHLERQFTKGMTWGTFGDWHIDHRRPLASFSFDGPEDPEFKAAWALTNLQPLWAPDNIAKRARLTCLL